VAQNSDHPERGPPHAAFRAFEAAARHASFAKAADELNVSPAAISQQIQSLEAYAGQPLFRRLGRGVELTDAGKAAFRYASEGLAALAEAARVMRLPLRSQRVSVSAAPSFAMKWLAPRLERFKEQHPEVEVWISADMAVVDFAVSDVDIAIRYGPGGYNQVNSERLMPESVLAICSPSLLDGAEGLKTPADLARFALLHDESSNADPSCPTWEMWLMARGVEGVDARKGLRLSPSSLVIEAAIAGKGVGLAKRQLAAADLALGRLVAPFGESATPVNFAYWMVWPRGRTVSPALRSFMNWLRAEGREGDLDQGAGI
jgi:LysR family transcriptional regulator, glycine cleavage system transcriptional activator